MEQFVITSHHISLVSSVFLESCFKISAVLLCQRTPAWVFLGGGSHVGGDVLSAQTGDVRFCAGSKQPSLPLWSRKTKCTLSHLAQAAAAAAAVTAQTGSDIFVISLVLHCFRYVLICCGPTMLLA